MPPRLVTPRRTVPTFATDTTTHPTRETSMNLEQMIRTAAALPKNSADRRALLAAIKVAIAPDTAPFVEWVLATQDAMREEDMVRFLEAKLGETPDPAPAKGQSGRKSRTTPLAVGEKVMVDKTKNANPLNTDACEQYHNRVGQVDSVTNEGLVVAFYRGNMDSWADDLTGEKQLFNGFQSGQKSGLFRWTPKSVSFDNSKYKKILFECVYLRGGTTVDTRRMEQIKQYVEQGLSRGESRSEIYYTGTVKTFAENQQGEAYFGLVAQQRDLPTNINPKKGKLLYLGVAGKRPGGWKEEAVKLGLLTP